MGDTLSLCLHQNWIWRKIDRFMYGLETESFGEDFLRDDQLYDFSKYLNETILNDKTNSLVVGKMKDKTCGVPTKIFLALKAEMYSFVVEVEYGPK